MYCRCTVDVLLVLRGYDHMISHNTPMQSEMTNDGVANQVSRKEER
jgi:hypothetical protein